MLFRSRAALSINRLNQITTGEKGNQDQVIDHIPEVTAGASSRPTEIDNIHLESCSMDERNKYVVERLERELNTTCIVVRPPNLYSHMVFGSTPYRYQAVLCSIAGAALVIATRPDFKSNPDYQTVNLLHAILLTLKRSGETPVVTFALEDPPSGAFRAAGYFYEATQLSLLAAVIAMLGKECLNRYSPRVGELASNHRRQNFDTLNSWPFNLLVFAARMLVIVAIGTLIFGNWERTWELDRNITYLHALIIVPALVAYQVVCFNIEQP